MKKTLLALAAIAASSAAFAQSSVTLYGVLDASVESVRVDSTTTRISSDNLSSSRLGFKGTEDLGGGTKAIFNLETNVKVDTGANGGGATRFFDRQAWLGLGGGFGELRLGRTDTLIGDIAGNVLSAQNYDDLKIIPTRAGNDYRRNDNAITYSLPTVVPGLIASLQYSTGTGAPVAGETPGTNAGRAIGVSVKYSAGPLSAGVGYLNAKDESTAIAGEQKANATLVYAGYDFGAAKLTAYYDAETRPTAVAAVPANNRRLKVAGAKLAVPFSPEFTLIVGGSTARNVNGTTTGDDNVHIATIKAIYSLSKRTSVYGLFTNVNNDTSTNRSVDNTAFAATTANDRTTRGFAVGVRHSF
jgi:GBP family porin